MFANSIAGFEGILSDSFATFSKLSEHVGSIVKEQTDHVKQAVFAQRDLIELATRSQKPSDSQLMSLLKPTFELIGKIQSIRDANRESEFCHHLSAIAEGISALGWVAVSPTPGPFVKEMLDSAQYYTNRVLVSFKKKDQTQVDWAKSWIQFLSELQLYVRKNHTTGLVWNAKGEAIAAAIGEVVPLPLLPAANDRSTSSVKTSVPVKKLPPKLPTNCKLEGKKWLVENQHDNSQLVIRDTNMSQSVVIYNCTDSLVVVRGKVNSITVNNCKKFSLLFDDIVSMVEFINSERVKVQVNGLVPTITLDKVDGIEVYLSKESLNCEIVSAKCSEINFSILDQSDEYVEHPIPEQFKSIWNGKGFTTVAIRKD